MKVINITLAGGLFLLLLTLLLPALTRADETNNPALIQKGETWASKSRLERISKEYVKQQKIEFSFEKTEKTVLIHKHGTNIVATISFFAGLGKPALDVEIAPNGTAITNHLATAICGAGGRQ